MFLSYFCLLKLCRYTPEERASIGKYACQNGVKAASIYFLRKLNTKIGKSSVHSIKMAYLACVRKKRPADGMIAELPGKKRGQPLLLGKHVEDQLQLYLKKLSEQGGTVSASVVVPAARGLLLAIDRIQLAEYGG